MTPSAGAMTMNSATRRIAAPFVVVGAMVGAVAPAGVRAQDVERFSLSGDVAIFNIAGDIRIERGNAAGVVIELKIGRAHV